jgi:hypothetical protein
MAKLVEYDHNEDVIVLKLTSDSMSTVENISRVGKAVLEVLRTLDHPVYVLTDWSDTYLPGDWALMEQLCKVTGELYKAGLLGIIRYGVYEPANRLALKTYSILSNRSPYMHQTRDEALQTLYHLRGRVLARASA